MTKLSLQETYAPKSICYGCGPANEHGLHVSSFEDGDTLVCEWGPDEKYQAFPGMSYGGLIACLLDCHCNWTAAWHLMKSNGLNQPPCTVTAAITVKFKRPTPSDKPVRLVSRVTDSKEDRATIEGELFSGDTLCATASGTFVAVKEGHPAYHRW